MENQPHTTRINQYVRLKLDGQDSLYQFAYAGAPGWVRGQDHDRLGYPQVFIEWDKNHWSYQGEPDKWALEAHFEPMEENVSQMPQNPEELMALFQKFLESQQPAGSDDKPTPAQTQEDDLKARWDKALADTQVLLGESDSFIAITVTRADRPGQPSVFVPRIVNFYKNAESGLLAELQLSKLAAMSHEEVIMDKVNMTQTNPPGDVQ